MRTVVFLVVLGSLALMYSILYPFPVLAFVGLGLIFWGIIFTYIRSEDYVRKTSLDDMVDYQQSIINQIITQFGCKGKPTFLPSKYFDNPETYKIYIPVKENDPLPTADLTQKEGVLFGSTSGILLTPPGASLARRFEKTLGTNFTNVDLRFLQSYLPKTIVEDLELAQDFEMRIEDKKIVAKITNSAYKYPLSSDEQEGSPFKEMWSPLTSAISCAVARASGKPVTIEKVQSFSKNKILQIDFKLIDER